MARRRAAHHAGGGSACPPRSARGRRGLSPSRTGSSPPRWRPPLLRGGPPSVVATRPPPPMPPRGGGLPQGNTSAAPMLSSVTDADTLAPLARRLQPAHRRRLTVAGSPSQAHRRRLTDAGSPTQAHRRPAHRDSLPVGLDAQANGPAVHPVPSGVLTGRPGRTGPVWATSGGEAGFRRQQRLLYHAEADAWRLR